jgi:ribose 5-phosphate isomerase B
MKLALGADHAGFSFKAALIKHLNAAGHSVVDCGTTSEASTDYPDYALRVAQAVADGVCERGILACGTGIGMCIAANKVHGVRAATVWSVETAKLASEHNWANVLCLPARFVEQSNLLAMADAWLKTPNDTSERHSRRVKKILEIESKHP